MIAGTLETAGWLATGATGAVLLRAARLEHLGRLTAARKTARRGGLALATWTVALAGLLVVQAVAVAASVGLLLAGWCALLAGLSRKPRPSGYAAVGLLLLAAITRLMTRAC